jgi:hypothetical protein
MTLGGGTHTGCGLMGRDGMLFHDSITDDDISAGAPYVEQACMWFDGVWDTVGTGFSR